MELTLQTIVDRLLALKTVMDKIGTEGAVERDYQWYLQAFDARMQVVIERDDAVLVFLDDERTIQQSCISYGRVEPIVVRDYQSFSEIIEYFGSFDNVIISFDHDLADFDENGVEKTGKDCVDALISHMLNMMEEDPSPALPQCVFHSANPIGCNNMLQLWKSFERHYHNS